MSVFGTRHAFRTTARASLRTARINASSSSSRIRMYSSSHGAPSTKTSSDTPWLIASALVFGPAFLYLVSPSAKEKAHHHEHIHKSEPAEAAPESEPDSKPAVVVMKDDEGTEANVAESIRQAEKDDVPKAEPAASESTDESPVSTAEATPAAVPVHFFFMPYFHSCIQPPNHSYLLPKHLPVLRPGTTTLLPIRWEGAETRNPRIWVNRGSSPARVLHPRRRRRPRRRIPGANDWFSPSGSDRCNPPKHLYTRSRTMRLVQGPFCAHTFHNSGIMRDCKWTSSYYHMELSIFY